MISELVWIIDVRGRGVVWVGYGQVGNSSLEGSIQANFSMEVSTSGHHLPLSYGPHSQVISMSIAHTRGS